MPKKKTEHEEIIVQAPPSLWQSLFELIKGSKVLQVGLMAIFFAIALAIVMAGEISIFGISIKGSGMQAEAPVTEESYADSTILDTLLEDYGLDTVISQDGTNYEPK
jgi:hypothetical protein